MSALVYLLSGHCFLTRTLVHDCFVAFHLLLGFLIAFAPHYLGYSMLDCFFYRLSADRCNTLSNVNSSYSRFFDYEHLHSPYERNTKPFYEQRLQDMIIEAIEFFCFLNKNPKNSDNEFIWRNFVANASHGFIIPEYTNVFVLRTPNVRLFWERATVLSGTVLNTSSADASNRIAGFYRFLDMVVKQNADANREFLDYYPYMAKMLFVVVSARIHYFLIKYHNTNFILFIFLTDDHFFPCHFHVSVHSKNQGDYF